MSSATPRSPQVFPTVRTCRLLAAALVTLQALVLVGFAVAWLVSLLRGQAVYPAAVVGLAVFALGAAGVLWLCARGVRREAAWTRAPVVTFQLLLGIMGAEWARDGAPVLGVLGVLVALLVTVLVLRPGVTQTRRPIPAED